MWARIVEFFVACWLAASPFVLHFSEESFLKANNIVCGILVALFALLSFCKRWGRMHLCTLGIGLWLWGISYMTFPLVASVPLENSALVGIVLLMLAIVPSHTARLSPSWHRFYR